MASEALLPIQGVTGEVYDDSSGLLLAVTSGGNVYAYNSETAQLASAHVATSLSGVALSPDGESLLIGVAGTVTSPSGGASNVVVRLDASTLTASSATFQAASTDAGVAAIAFGGDGRAYVSTASTDQGFAPVRAFDEGAAGVVIPQVVTAALLSAPTYLSTSDDGRYLLLAPGDISNGQLYLYDTKAQAITTSTDLYAVGAGPGFNVGNTDFSPQGLIVDNVGSEVLIFDSDLQLAKNLTASLGGDVITGAAFAQNGQELLLWDSTAAQVRVFDTQTWEQTQDYQISSADKPQDAPFAPGAGGLVAAQNGSMAFLNTAAGVEQVDLSAPATRLGVGEFATAADQTLHAAAGGAFYFVGAGADDRVVLTGNVQDYTLSRVQPGSGVTGDEVGAFVLTASNGSGVYAIAENIATVQFQNGQYLSLNDLPGYVHGSTMLEMGGGGDDFLYQTPSDHYELFVGGDGTDRLFLNGNVWDYTVRSFTATAATGADGSGGQTYSGLELVGNNGSGALLIDSSVETVQFQNGQYLALKDVPAYVAANADHSVDHVDIGLDGDVGEPLTYAGAGRAMLNGDVGDYTLSRDAAGDFVLDTHQASNGVEDLVTLSQDVTSVQFGNGQYLSLKDLGAYVTGSDVFTQGGAGNDLLFTPSSGDAFVVGGGGADNLYLTGNTRDYTIQSVDLAAQNGHAAIDGVELIADNGSGHIYIDQSVETVHFQDGQYLAFQDLTAYIHAFHG